jgi:predicted ATPase
MMDNVENKIKKLLKTAGDLYYRLILLVGNSGSGKTAVIKNLAEHYDTTLININLALSKEMLELTKKQRSLKLSEKLFKLVDYTKETAFLDNIEMLFDSSLKQDPLKLLQRLSRNIIIIASWNGSINNKRLTYATPDHNEYKNYDSKDTLIVCMNDDQ